MIANRQKSISSEYPRPNVNSSNEPIISSADFLYTNMPHDLLVNDTKYLLFVK